MNAPIPVSVKVAVSDLSGPLLRHAMAQARGEPFEVFPPVYGSGHRILVYKDRGFYRPDVSWEQAGPIIDRHWREITVWLTKQHGVNWRDAVDGKPGDILLWFCRGFVGSRLGDEVTLPFELVSHPSS